MPKFRGTLQVLGDVILFHFCVNTPYEVQKPLNAKSEMLSILIYRVFSLWGPAAVSKNLTIPKTIM